MAVYIFVYGTLLSNFGHKMHNLLKNDCAYIGEGIYNGQLFDLGRYPGIIPLNNSVDRVKGEVYLVKNYQILPKLDEYEGLNEPEPREYVREKSDIKVNGEIISCWVYTYKLSVADKKWIKCGDYIKYISQKK